jgi:NAD dependent epimerase/dehydratase family enzyme
MQALTGEMAKELILFGARVTPAKLLANGYAFAHTDLEPALREILKKPARGR